MSICTHCGRDHAASGGVCADAGKPGTPLQASNKTMFGVPPAPVPPAPGPPLPKPSGGKPGLAATLLAPAAKLPPQRPPLPSAEEARQNPNLVITLDKAPAPAAPPPPPPAAEPALLLDRDEPVDLPSLDPSLDPPVDLPTLVTPITEPASDPDRPTDLPRPGSGPRFALPEPPGADATGVQAGRAADRLGERLAADVKSVIDLLGWAATLYLRQPKQLLLLVGFLVLPVSILESCVVAGVSSRSTTLSVTSTTTVDFSARKAELVARIQESQARRKLDGQAVAELAALTAAETAHAPLPSVEIQQSGGWLWERLAMFLQGLLIFGLAFPIACGVVALAWLDHESGAATPALADVWPLLVARGELFLVTLVPAAVLVALGHALFVLPGLVLSVLFLFLPHVVLFEKKGGRDALERGIELARGDLVRVVLTFLAFGLAGTMVAVLAELLLPTSESRASAFLHFIVCDLLSVAILPIPALVLARIYLDLRRPSGATPERLSQAARG